MYLGKPEHLVKQTGVFTTAERSAVVDSIMQYRAEATATDWEYDELLSVESQLQSGCSSSNDSGHFSYVIDHPTDQDKIIKVQVKPSDAYPLFVNEVLEGRVRRYVPKFYTTGQILGHNVYIMERVKVLGEIWEGPLYEQCSVLENVRHTTATSLQREVGMYKHLRQPIVYAVLLIKRSLAELVVGTGSFFDLHSCNWGVRKDGTIVCLDPIA